MKTEHQTDVRRTVKKQYREISMIWLGVRGGKSINTQKEWGSGVMDWRQVMTMRQEWAGQPSKGSFQMTGRTNKIQEIPHEGWVKGTHGRLARVLEDILLEVRQTAGWTSLNRTTISRTGTGLVFKKPGWGWLVMKGLGRIGPATKKFSIRFWRRVVLTHSGSSGSMTQAAIMAAGWMATLGGWLEQWQTCWLGQTLAKVVVASLRVQGCLLNELLLVIMMIMKAVLERQRWDDRFTWEEQGRNSMERHQWSEQEWEAWRV